jgi:hypothetical protein
MPDQDPSGDGSSGLDVVTRAAHDDAVGRGDAMYEDPRTGLFVMTAATLARRGYCCGSGCRHCPYDPDEQRRAGRPGA